MQKTGAKVARIGGDKDVIVAYVRMVNSGEAFMGDDQLLDGLECVIVRQEPTEVAVGVLGSQRVQYCSLVSEMGKEVGDVVDKTEEGADILS